jgi:hypothetical protein
LETEQLIFETCWSEVLDDAVAAAAVVVAASALKMRTTEVGEVVASWELERLELCEPATEQTNDWHRGAEEGCLNGDPRWDPEVDSPLVQMRVKDLFSTDRLSNKIQDEFSPCWQNGQAGVELGFGNRRQKRPKGWGCFEGGEEGLTARDIEER